jgi:tRNA(Ile)-lysidine synthase
MSEPHPVAALSSFLRRRPELAAFPRVLLVACSGGADSVALLRAAVAAAPQVGWRVEALHCDHGLRRAAKRDAAFVRTLAERLGVVLHAFATRIGKGSGLESRARAWRRKCYGRAAAMAGAKLILLGHHAGDQAETLLLNLVRGAGTKGAAAMTALAPLESAPGVLLGRPFLGLEPELLRAWLRNQRQPWCEDSSNRDVSLSRNRLRHKVLPQLLAINPAAVRHLAEYAASLAAAKEEQDLAGLLKLDRAARRRARAVLECGHGQADLGQGWTLKASRGQVLVERSSPETLFRPQVLRLGEETRWGEDWLFRLELDVPTARRLKERQAFWFHPAVLERSPAVRPARPGERLHPFGGAGSRLLFDLLAEAGVPRWERAAWPVLTAGADLLGLPGVRRACGWEAEPGQKALRLSWFRSASQAGLP